MRRCAPWRGRPNDPCSETPWARGRQCESALVAGEPAESAAAPMRCRGAAGDAKAGALRPPKLRPAAAAETVRSGSARRLKWLRAARRAAQFLRPRPAATTGADRKACSHTPLAQRGPPTRESWDDKVAAQQTERRSRAKSGASGRWSGPRWPSQGEL